jgi:hypothetical protein
MLLHQVQWLYSIQWDNDYSDEPERTGIDWLIDCGILQGSITYVL